MAKNFAARKDGEYIIVGILPDVCHTPGIPTPVPYPVVSFLGGAEATVTSVKFSKNEAFVHGKSFVPKTIGDEAGSEGGVVTGTVSSDCWSIQHSPDTNVGGHPLCRVGDLFAMNGKFSGN